MGKFVTYFWASKKTMVQLGEKYCTTLALNSTHGPCFANKGYKSQFKGQVDTAAFQNISSIYYFQRRHQVSLSTHMCLQPAPLAKNLYF
jgi:hypothetical protein